VSQPEAKQPAEAEAEEGAYNVATSAASAYARLATTDFNKYSMAGPARQPDARKLASQIRQVQGSLAASRLAASAVRRKAARRLFLMRHGERMDRLFPEWLSMAITDDVSAPSGRRTRLLVLRRQGTYMPYDMNMPLTMLDRSTLGGWAAYETDPPITEMGALSGQMVGRGMQSCQVDVRGVYASPALRCVQTAHAVLKTLDEKLDLRICVEPGLFEWLAW